MISEYIQMKNKQIETILMQDLQISVDGFILPIVPIIASTITTIRLTKTWNSPIILVLSLVSASAIAQIPVQRMLAPQWPKRRAVYKFIHITPPEYMKKMILIKKHPFLTHENRGQAESKS